MYLYFLTNFEPWVTHWLVCLSVHACTPHAVSIHWSIHASFYPSCSLSVHPPTDPPRQSAKLLLAATSSESAPPSLFHSFCSLAMAPLKLPRPTKIHHMVEDFLTYWTSPLSHLLPLRRFLEAIFQDDMREYFSSTCLAAALTHMTVPTRCQDYLQGRGFLGNEEMMKAADDAGTRSPIIRNLLVDWGHDDCMFSTILWQLYCRNVAVVLEIGTDTMFRFVDCASGIEIVETRHISLHSL